ncbi:hypothetical protein EVAR_35473_1 [Eumeta japonica]|uniref:Uncharacterized protein n=1 Tax=Eumeta variegata TaxID=151549 RepID=A0A4C1XMC1_EUMVA|nr:hypothetical protein EVAR_35473_1 [Eumeta japonica]
MANPDGPGSTGLGGCSSPIPAVARLPSIIPHSILRTPFARIRSASGRSKKTNRESDPRLEPRLSRATSPMKTNKNKNKRQASSSSDEGATCSDSTVVGSDSESENSNTSFTLVEVSAPTQAVIAKTAPRTGAKPTAPPRPKLPPPIFLRKGVNFLQISADCTRLRINYISTNLVDFKVQFHSYALEEERKLKAVIRGIPTDFPVDEIQADLCGQGFPMHSVHRPCCRDGSPLWLVLAILPRTEEAKNIFNNLNMTRLRNHRTLYVDMFPHVVTHRPSTIDIALTKGVALNFNSIETIHGLTSDHRPVILKIGPPDGGRPIPIRKITNWKKVSTALEEIDTPNLNSIPNDIASTDEIDFAIGALTNHIRTVVEESEREVPASSDRRKFPPDILELIRAKNATLRRASAYPTPE